MSKNDNETEQIHLLVVEIINQPYDLQFFLLLKARRDLSVLVYFFFRFLNFLFFKILSNSFIEVFCFDGEKEWEGLNWLDTKL